MVSMELLAKNDEWDTMATAYRTYRVLDTTRVIDGPSSFSSERLGRRLRYKGNKRACLRRFGLFFCRSVYTPS